MKIAVTGATGRVGRQVATHALECGHEIVGIDVNIPAPSTLQDSLGHLTGDPQRYTFIQVDLKNFEKVIDALKGCDAVIHLAVIINPEKENTHNE
jgi:nucleoside-diphosphate-sugar epimerase